MSEDNTYHSSLRDLCGEKELSWRERTEPIIRFWESDSGECWGFPFFSLSAARFVPHAQLHSQRLILYFPLATLTITGSEKVIEFYEAFEKQRAASLKADGKEILSVKVSLNGEKES